MKKGSINIFVILLTVLAVCFCFIGCSKGSAATTPGDGTGIEQPGDEPGGSTPGSTPGTPTPGTPTPSTPTPTGPTAPESVSIKVMPCNVVTAMTKPSAGRYTATVELTKGETVSVYDSAGGTYTTFSGGFTGTAAASGTYEFELNWSATGSTVTVSAPGGRKALPTTVTITYSNSNYWTNVYAYVWNSASDEPEPGYPGTKLDWSRDNSFGQGQYELTVNYTEYDRVIFNNGESGDSNLKTRDLVVNPAVSGYYGDGTPFVDGACGTVIYEELEDAKNLAYIDTHKKYISVYTPVGYDANKQYDVIYMFDGQHLYKELFDPQPAKGWSAEAAVTARINNGGDGVIIVGIDNSTDYRDTELTMDESFGALTSLQSGCSFKNGYHLDDLGNFVLETVMPWVQERYSVKTDRASTGIAGSSSGGLAAYYLGLRDNDKYGFIGAFSPANGLFEEADWQKFYNKLDLSAGRPEVYVYCGFGDDLEKDLTPATKNIKPGLTAHGFVADTITECYISGASHHENYWEIVFSDFLYRF